MRPSAILPAVGLTFLLAAGVAPPAARADTAAAMDPALAKLQTMVTNLGYATTAAADNSHFRIEYQGPNSDDYTVDFMMSSDDTLIYTYTYLETYEAGQMNKVPFQKLLEFQNNGNVYFSLQKNAQGTEDFYANSVFGAPGIAPPDLRDELDYLIKRMDQSSDLWDPKQWK
jgi:hypothetical protein